MADEPIIPPVTAPETSRAQERITELSDKVKTGAEALATSEAAKAEADKRAAFAEGFVDVVSTNPAAKDHKDEIKEKVLKGYTLEDATFAVLGKAGKLGSQAPVTPQVAGGSATTSPQSGEKQVKDMTQAERRAQLSKDLIWS